MQLPIVAKVRNSKGGKDPNWCITIPAQYVRNGLLKPGCTYQLTIENTPILEAEATVTARTGFLVRDRNQNKGQGRTNASQGYQHPAKRASCAIEPGTCLPARFFRVGEDVPADEVLVLVGVEESQDFR